MSNININAEQASLAEIRYAENSPPSNQIPSPLRTVKEILEGYGKKEKKEGAEKSVLDPEHPLMQKYQKDLKEHLLQLHHETDEQIKELNAAIQEQTKRNDELGKQVCLLQKKILQQTDVLNKLQHDYQELSKKKEQIEKKKDETLESHRAVEETLKSERFKDEQLQKQLEDLSFQVVQLTTLQMESYADSSTMKCAVEKTNKQKMQLEIEKLRQDLLISRFEADKYNFEDKIKLYKSQCAIKKEELADLRKILIDAITDLQSLHYEKLQLMQQWRYSISALEKRDQSTSAMRDSVRACEDDMRTLHMDIISHKKSVRKELEQNEKLTHQLHYREADVGELERTISDSKQRQEYLSEKYAFFEQLVQHTNAKLDELNNEKLYKTRELEAKGRELEKAFNRKREMEQKYMEVLHEKLTATKASQYAEKMIKECQQNIENLEMKCTLKAGDKAKLNLKLLDIQSHIDSMEEDMKETKKEIERKEKTITRSEAEIAKGHCLIEKKQQTVVELNKKLNFLISSAGGQELGPMEREIANFKKEIKASEQTRREFEKEWLRLQGELITLTNEASLNMKNNDLHSKRITILSEKKIRMEADVNKEEKEIKNLQNEMKRINCDITYIGRLLNKEKGIEEKLLQDAEFLKSDLVTAVKEAEKQWREKIDELDQMKLKRTRLLCKFIQTQREIITWEGKLRIAEETRNILKSESHADQMFHLKSEIRRLQIRLKQIKKDQELILQHLERTTLEYVNIHVKADIKCLRGVKKISSEYSEKKVKRLKKKINEDAKELENYKELIKQKAAAHSSLRAKYDEMLSARDATVAKINIMEKDTERKQREKWQKVIRLSMKQKRSKYLQQIKDGKYVRAVRNDSLRLNEIEKLHRSLEMIESIAEEIMSEYPELTKDLFRVLDYTAVSSKL